MVIETKFPEEGYGKAVVTVHTGLELAVKGSLAYGEKVVDAEGQDGCLVFSLEQPALWSAEEPNLYRLQVAVLDGAEISDTITRKIGLRSVEMLSGKGMFVNGVPVKLRGVCVHQDVGCQGVAAKEEIWRSRLENLKEMGCNAIRAAHHIYSEEFMDLCDEMGFYVYEECFDKWTGGHYGGFFETEWRKDVDAMVKRDRNRPCVVIWGVGNEVENQAQPSMLKILEMLVSYVKSLDITRPVTYAMNPHFKRESNVDMSKVTDIQQFVDEADDTEIWDVQEKVERIARISALVDILACRQVTVTPGPAVKLGFEQESVKLPARPDFQVMFTVRALDAEGNPYFRESSKVRFRVEGPARILGTDNGDAKSHECYLEPFRHMYHGAVSVLLSLTGEPGRIALFADAEGMRSGMMVICAE